MLKRILALLLWLGGSAAFAQSINGVSPSILSIDGANVTSAKVLTLPQVQATIVYNVSPTPSPMVPQPTQVSSWYQLNGNGAELVEFSSNTFTGSYSVQVSDNLTPVSTPGDGIHTITQDTATYSSGGQGAQTKNWAYLIKAGWRYIRFLVIPESVNQGTLNLQVRLFGNGTVPGDAIRSYSEGVQWKSREGLCASTAFLSSTNYYDYKMPTTAGGFALFTNVSAVAGAATIISTIEMKDPVTGILQPIGVSTAQAVTGLHTTFCHPGYANPYPVATPPAGFDFISIPTSQDIVIKSAVSGAGTITLSQEAVPLN